MIFIPLRLAGAYLIEPERIGDERGFFARTWCREEFERHGLNPHLAQCNVSYNVECGTIRGLHYQARPHEEAKLVRCTQGAIHDVIVNLRPSSATCRQWVAAVLTAEDRRMLYIPEGFAHGFQTLADATEVFYQMSAAFQPQSASGVRHDDPALGITWPLDVTRISSKDRGYPLLEASSEAAGP